MPTAPASPLVAVDANVLIDLGERSESVMDALATIRQRLRSPRIVIPPTAKLELTHIARQGDTAKDRNLALSGIAAARRARIVPVNLMPVGRGIVERVAEKLRSAELLPSSEVNDSQLVAESALLGARLLLSSDEHSRRIDFALLTIELQGFDLTAPIIATPAQVVRKFFQHRFGAETKRRTVARSPFVISDLDSLNTGSARVCRGLPPARQCSPPASW